MSKGCAIPLGNHPIDVQVEPEHLLFEAYQPKGLQVAPALCQGVDRLGAAENALPALPPAGSSEICRQRQLWGVSPANAAVD